MSNGPHKFGAGVLYGTGHKYGELAEIFSGSEVGVAPVFSKEVNELYTEPFVGSGALASPWVRIFGDKTINKVGGIGVANVQFPGAIIYQHTTGVLTDCYAKIKFTGGAITTQNLLGVLLRQPTSGSFIGYDCVIRVDGGLGAINRRDPASTLLGALFTFPALVYGDIIEMTMIGTEIKVYIAGTLVATRNDSTYASGYSGIYYAALGAAATLLEVDDWSAGETLPIIPVYSSESPLTPTYTPE